MGARAADDLERFETAFAVLYRSEDYVYKLRKPIALWAAGELRDLRPADARRRACEREAAMNATLAPEIASTLVALVREADSTLRFVEVDDAGRTQDEIEIVDWALRMKRLPDEDRADRRLERGTLDDARLERVARHLARFHERARAGEPVSARDPVDRLYAQIGSRLVSEEPECRETPLPVELKKIEAWQRSTLETHGERFRRQAAGASIRMGHGELGLDHVFVGESDGVHVLAGLEMMSTLLRDADVVADVSLLSSDLASKRRVDLAERFVAEYTNLTNDFDLYPLLDFYASLRATERGKLEWFAADLCQAGLHSDPKRAERARSKARAFFKLASSARARPLLPPTVVVMGGQVASGKSTVAKHIGRRIGAPVVSSDATRDFLLGSRLNEELHEMDWERAYLPGFGVRVYEEVFRRAGEVLESGRSVVIDGCFRSVEQRAGARRLAQKYGEPFLFVEASVSREVQHRRLAERATRDDVALEVWTDIADALRAQWEPVDELPGDEYLRLDTGRPLEAHVDAIEVRLATWPEGLVG